MKIARTPLIAMTVAVCATAATLWRDPPMLLLWNVTASAPIGLYRVISSRSLRRGDLVVIRPAAPLARFLAERGYLPLGAPLIKPLAALPGQRVCRAGDLVHIDGALVAKARSRDRRGRSLPVWRGCRTLLHGQVFVLNPAREDSLDGRYFGAVPVSSVIGLATPVWVSSGSYSRAAPAPS